MNYDEPIIITNTKVPKMKRSGGGNSFFNFLSPNKLLIVGAVLVTIGVFLPYITLSASLDDINISKTYTLYDANLFSAITVIGYGFFSLFAAFFESRWIMMVVAVECFVSTYKVIRAFSVLENRFNNEFKFLGYKFNASVGFGFIVIVFAMIILLSGIIWKFKRDWLSSVF